VAPQLKTPELTLTGLLLMVIAFALAWVPLVDFVAGILTIIGVIYLWNGRRELGPQHSAEVKVGVLLFVGAIVVAIVGAIVLAAATFSFHINLNSTQPVVTHPPISLGVEIAVAVVLTVAAGLGAACWLKLPYSLADATTRNLLWAAAALDVALGALYAVAEVQAFASLGALFGTGSTSGPVVSPLLAGLLLVVPDLLFLLAYLRVRKRLLDGVFPSAAAVTPRAY